MFILNDDFGIIVRTPDYESDDGVKTNLLLCMQLSKEESGDGTFSLASKGTPRVVFILGEDFTILEAHTTFSYSESNGD